MISASYLRSEKNHFPFQRKGSLAWKLPFTGKYQFSATMLLGSPLFTFDPCCYGEVPSIVLKILGELR